MRMNQQLGVSYPAYAGATGKLLLAYLESTELDRYLAGVELQQLTARTIIDRKQLRSDLEIIRQLGISVSRGERVDDAVAVSAPLRDRNARVVAAVTVSGVASRFGREELLATVRATGECAAAISRELGWASAQGADSSTTETDRAYDLLLAEHCEAVLENRRSPEPLISNPGRS
jgi:DNA-binding IclR family transcriptional regulator